MNCSRNDVVLLPIPFTDLTSRKVRPAIIVGGKGADLFVVPISSVLANTRTLRFWSGKQQGSMLPPGLKRNSRPFEEKLVVRIIGRITAVDRESLNDKLRTWLQL